VFKEPQNPKTIKTNKF